MRLRRSMVRTNIIATSCHSQVVRILYELCKPFYKEAYAHQIGEYYIPIDIISAHSVGQKAEVYSYNPDVWGKLKNNKIDVYEVWDGQSEFDSVGDIVLSALTPNVSKMSVICFDSVTSDLAKKLAKVMLPSIRNAKGEILLDEDNVLPIIVSISRDVQENPMKTREFLTNKLNLVATSWETGRKVWYQPPDSKWKYEAPVKEYFSGKPYPNLHYRQRLGF